MGLRVTVMKVIKRGRKVIELRNLRSHLESMLTLTPEKGSVRKGLTECACNGDFLGISIFSFSSVVWNVLVIGETVDIKSTF